MLNAEQLSCHTMLSYAKSELEYPKKLPAEKVTFSEVSQHSSGLTCIQCLHKSDCSPAVLSILEVAADWHELFCTTWSSIIIIMTLSM